MQILQSNHVFNLVGDYRPEFNYTTLSFSCEKCNRYICAYVSRSLLEANPLGNYNRYAYVNKSKTKITLVEYNSYKLTKLAMKKCSFTYDDVLVRDIIQ